MYQLLVSYAKGVSDMSIAFGLLICVMAILSCWYFCFFRPRHQEVLIVRQQTRMLVKRVATLKKTMQRSHHILKELSSRSRLFEQRKHFRSLSEALSFSLKGFHSCGVRMVSCKMNPKKEYLFGVGQMVFCELQGSFEALLAIIVSASLVWKECRIELNAEGLSFAGTFAIYTLKGPQ